MIPLTFDLIKICQLGILKCVLALEGVWKQHHLVPCPLYTPCSSESRGVAEGREESLESWLSKAQWRWQ